MSISKDELRQACDSTFGGIVSFLVQYCGFSQPQTARVGKRGEVPLTCPHHASDKNNRGENCTGNNEKGLFRCYTCESTGLRASGSYVDAASIYLHMTEGEAIAWLIDKCGIQKGVSRTPDAITIRRRYVRLCHEKMWQLKEKNAEARKAYAYLQGRGFDDVTIRSFQIGLGASSPKSSVIAELKAGGLTEKDLLNAGILAKSARGNIYSPFMNRVVMMSGENIYGRSLRSKEEERLPHLYSKGKLSTFGRVDERCECVFVVESIFDALTVSQFIRATSMNWGVVATLGTKGTSPEELAKALAAKDPAEVVIVPDADPWVREGHKHAAGQTAGIEKAKVFEQHGLSVRILPLPEGQDPNDLGRSGMNGAEFMALVQKAIPTLAYRLYCAAQYFDLGEVGGLSGYLNVARRMAEGKKPELVVRYLKRLTGANEGYIRETVYPELASLGGNLTESDRMYITRDILREWLAKGLSPEDVMQVFVGGD